MNVILTTGILLILISIIFRKKLPPYWGMIFVFLITAFQEGLDTDFIRYKQDWENYAVFDNMQSRTAESELFWNALCSNLAPIIPFWLFIVLLSGFQCWILWQIGKEFGPKIYGWVGPILYFFTFYMMLIGMSALRQGLAVGLCVLAFYLASKKKNVLWSVIVLISAYFTHNSAVVAAPLVLLQMLAQRRYEDRIDDVVDVKNKSLIFPILMTLSYLVIYLFKEKALVGWLTSLSLAMGDSMRLSGYLVNDLEHQFNISWLIILYNGIIVFLCSWFMQRTTHRYRILAIASIIGCYMDMLLFGIGSLPRIATFYIVYNIFVYPKIIEMIHQRYGAKYATLLVILLIGYAVKTSLPMITSTELPFPFANYRFVFM